MISKTIYDNRIQKRQLEDKPARVYLTSDWHIGKGHNHDEAAMWKFVETFNADKTPQKILFVLGDLMEGHVYGHKYANALDVDKVVAEQYAQLKQVLRELEYDPDLTFLTLGNHDKAVFRLTGDLYAVEMREDFARDDRMMTYTGWAISARFKWPDGATLYTRGAHGMRPISSQKVMRHWDEELIIPRARRNLAQVCLGFDQGLPWHDLYAIGHTHQLDAYRFRESPFGPVSDWPAPFNAVNTGCFYRDGVCPSGDYHEEAIGREYEVGWATVDFDSQSHYRRIWGKEGTETRKVRKPTNLQLHFISNGSPLE